jgi:hypothetical protein
MKIHHIIPLLAGSLALGAFPAFANEHDGASKLKKLDSDGDGRVSRAEFVAGKQQKIQKLDANNDGVVTAGEAPAKAEKKHWWSRSDKSADKVNTADANSDGQVTAAEASAAADIAFDKHDANADGFLTAAELDAMVDKKK